MKVFASILFGTFCTLAAPALAAELNLPANARKTLQKNSNLDSYSAPLTPFIDGELKSQVIEGRVSRSAWSIGSSGVTTLQILAPLREQLISDGYTIVLDCDQTACGGFDFRFGVEVLPAPNMYVNIRAFRFLTAVKGDAAAPKSVATLMVSTSGTGAFVQVIQAGELEDKEATVTTQAAVPTSEASTVVVTTSLDKELLNKGAVVLKGLDFATGTSNLGKGPFPVLEELAKFFAARDDIKLVLVGHTDSDGALDFNIALSKRRAASVRTRLLELYGLDAGRVAAEGNGYLSPLSSNLKAEGRTANRRVEAIVLPLK